MIEQWEHLVDVMILIQLTPPWMLSTQLSSDAMQEGAIFRHTPWRWTVQAQGFIKPASHESASLTPFTQIYQEPITRN